jgi:hypothetical protein
LRNQANSDLPIHYFESEKLFWIDSLFSNQYFRSKSVHQIRRMAFNHLVHHAVRNFFLLSVPDTCTDLGSQSQAWWIPVLDGQGSPVPERSDLGRT